MQAHEQPGNPTTSKFYGPGTFYGGNSDPTHDPSAPTTLTGYYASKQGTNQYQKHNDPYMQQWAQQAGQQQGNDRQSLQDLYAQLQAQAAGGITPQQQQQRAGMMQAAQMQQGMANSAPGGARARSAAMGGLTQQAGIQGAENTQNMNMQKASDQISARNQMMQVASAQRAQDLQAQGLTAEDAQRQADLEAKARGMNIQSNLGYAGLEGNQISDNWSQYLAGMRSGAGAKKQDQAQKDQITGGVMTGAGMTMAML
jgi:hypothetical protein